MLATLQLTSDGLYVASSLAGSRVLFNGVLAPLIYVSSGQVSAIVPAAIAGRTNTEMKVEFDGRVSAGIVLPVVTEALGIFTLDASGRGQAAALNQDNSFNIPGRPAVRGSIITLYATGVGQMIPPQEDGRVVMGPVLPRPNRDVIAQVGGFDAEVLYADAAPGLVNGVLQVNLRIPDQSTLGGAALVTLRIGNSTSQTGVTVVVEPAQ